MLGLKPLPEGSDPSAREAEVLRDLYWLLQQGHVVDFAKKGLEIASKAPPRRKPSKEQAKTPAPDVTSAPPAVVLAETSPAPEPVLEEVSEQESSQVEQRPSQ